MPCPSVCRTDVKPGTVEDALSVLNPSLFGPTCSVAARAFPVGVGRLPTPGSHSNPSDSFRLPTTNAANTDATKAALLQISSEPGGARNRRTERKKKVSLPSKHITKVAAQAEAKARQAKLNSAQAHGALNTGPIRARQDEMDAFLFSDPESDEKEVMGKPSTEDILHITFMSRIDYPGAPFSSFPAGIWSTGGRDNDLVLHGVLIAELGV